MANYYGSGRTNYFRPKSIHAFKAEMEKYDDITVVDGNPGHVCLLVNDPDGYGGFPSWDHEKDEEIDFFAIVAAHLADDEVAIFQHVGAEKLRYLSGYSLAVTNNDTGEPQYITINIDDIYTRVNDEWNLEPDRAIY